MQTFDLDAVKLQADLLALCERDTHLKRVANTNGGEYAGPCTFCGGRDRFRVQPNAKPFPLWMCRHCTGSKWDTVIGYIARRDNLDPTRRADLGEICQRSGVLFSLPGENVTGREILHREDAKDAKKDKSGGENAASRNKSDFSSSSRSSRLGGANFDPSCPPYLPPDAAWQAAAAQIVTECEATLWQPRYRAVLDYLHGRGLRDETIQHFHLGYCATGEATRYGREIGGLYVPRGLVIPCQVAGKFWYLKIRLMPGVPCRCQQCKADLPGPGHCPQCDGDTRYLGVKGNKTNAIYNADALPGALMAMFCEGEFDCMTAYQEFGGIIPTVTFGSATNHPDMGLWGSYLSSLYSILITYDTDLSGQKGARWLQEVSDCARLAPLPAGVKDINEYLQQGGDLLSWAVDYQTFYSQEIFR
jgi:hypothetical protein